MRLELRVMDRLKNGHETSNDEQKQQFDDIDTLKKLSVHD